MHTVVFAVAQLNIANLKDVLKDVSDPSSVNYGKHWTKTAITKYTSNTEGRQMVLKHLRSIKDVKVDIESQHEDYVVATAPIHAWELMLKTTFHNYEFDDRNNTPKIIVRAKEYWIPLELSTHVSAVFNTVQFPFPNGNNHYDMGPVSLNSNNEEIISKFVTPALIKKYYNVMNDIGSLQVTQAVYETIGEGASPSDLSTFQIRFNLVQQEINEAPSAQVNNNFCNIYPSSCTEGNLDVQYIMGIAQNTYTIFDYWDSKYYPHDWMLGWITKVAKSLKPANVYSISYGAYELFYSQSYMDAFNTEAIKLGVMGTTIVVASGDDGVAGFSVRNETEVCGYHSFFPASSPYVLAVGATNGPQEGKPETACQSGGDVLITSGGGFSILSDLPSWQSDAVKGYFKAVDGTVQEPFTSDYNIPVANISFLKFWTFNKSKRGYPDVSLLGHNYKVVINGYFHSVDGTSASAPVMAAFVSLVNAQRLKQGKPLMGFINPFIYKYSSSFINDITSGDNKCSALYCSSYIYYFNSRYCKEYNNTCCKEGFHATKGWDPVTGLGSIDFENFSTTAMGIVFTQSTSSSSSSSSLETTTLILIIVVVVIGTLLIMAVGVIVYCLHAKNATVLAPTSNPNVVVASSFTSPSVISVVRDEPGNGQLELTPTTTDPENVKV